jgi:hypothetical protein
VGGELAGHYYFRENYYCDSGMMAALAVLEVLAVDGRPLSRIIGDIRKYSFSGELNFAVPNGQEILERMKAQYQDGTLTAAGSRISRLLREEWTTRGSGVSAADGRLDVMADRGQEGQLPLAEAGLAAVALDDERAKRPPTGRERHPDPVEGRCPDQLHLAPGEVQMHPGPRNRPGRTAEGSFSYLASPATCAATAVEGRIADPRSYL